MHFNLKKKYKSLIHNKIRNIQYNKNLKFVFIYHITLLETRNESEKIDNEFNPVELA